jgi:hypothetical protein
LDNQDTDVPKTLFNTRPQSSSNLEPKTKSAVNNKSTVVFELAQGQLPLMSESTYKNLKDKFMREIKERKSTNATSTIFSLMSNQKATTTVLNESIVTDTI